MFEIIMEAYSIPFATPFSASMTLAECLELQNQLPDHRFEYIGGIAYEKRLGASRIHQTVAGDLFFALNEGLEGRSCRVYLPGLALRFEDKDDFCYPDVMVECPPGTEDYVIAPTLIAELLSPSTRLYDLSIKKNAYLMIRSLRHLLLIDPQVVSVEHYFRTDLSWQYEYLTDLSDVLYLATWDLKIPLAEVYQG